MLWKWYDARTVYIEAQTIFAHFIAEKMKSGAKTTAFVVMEKENKRTILRRFDMDKLIKRFISWYLRYRCNAMFELNGIVVRAFSEEFYETELRDYINTVARARHNQHTKRF